MRNINLYIYILLSVLLTTFIARDYEGHNTALGSAQPTMGSLRKKFLNMGVSDKNPDYQMAKSNKKKPSSNPAPVRRKPPSPFDDKKTGPSYGSPFASMNSPGRIPYVPASSRRNAQKYNLEEIPLEYRESHLERLRYEEKKLESKYAKNPHKPVGSSKEPAYPFFGNAPLRSQEDEILHVLDQEVEYARTHPHRRLKSILKPPSVESEPKPPNEHSRPRKTKIRFKDDRTVQFYSPGDPPYNFQGPKYNQAA